MSVSPSWSYVGELCPDDSDAPPPLASEACVMSLAGQCACGLRMTIVSTENYQAARCQHCDTWCEYTSPPKDAQGQPTRAPRRCDYCTRLAKERTA